MNSYNNKYYCISVLIFLVLEFAPPEEEGNHHNSVQPAKFCNGNTALSKQSIVVIQTS